MSPSRRATEVAEAVWYAEVEEVWYAEAEEVWYVEVEEVWHVQVLGEATCCDVCPCRSKRDTCAFSRAISES